MPLVAGDVVGPYKIIEKLGQGGMATVYKAYHAGLDRYVALKVLHSDLTEDPTFTVRFQREARLVAKLDHSNIVSVHDFAEHDGYPYLVMKFIEGETLKARLNGGPLTAEEITNVVESVGSALAYAHQQGILHRDIKPSNVLIARDGRIYLADFGLARIAQSGSSTISSDAVMGTPQYISPEQAVGKSDLDEGTDIYSFGVMLYEMVVGQVPYSADTPFSIIYDHIYSPLPLPRSINLSVPESVERVLLKTLSKDRHDRYATVTELVAAFKGAWEAAGVPIQGTAIKLSKQPGQAGERRERPHETGAAKRSREAAAVVRAGPKPFSWLFLAGGLFLATCCVIAGALSLPGAINWIASFSPTPTAILPTPTQLAYCTGEQTWLSRDYFPEAEIEICWNQDHYLSDIAFYNGEWTLVMTKTLGYTDQAYLTGAQFPTAKIREYWDQGYDITSTTYLNEEWIVVMSMGTGFTNQSYFNDASFPAADIQEYWDKGYAITSLGYGDEGWFVVMTEGSQLDKQVYFTEASFPESKIRTYWDSDYYITSVVYGNGLWAVVMSTGGMYSNQYYYHEETFPEDGIREDWDSDFFITNLFYGDSLWMVVMSKP
jgi:tRNA A-37 threonylcarbamoyl transferase component Bud32